MKFVSGSIKISSSMRKPMLRNSILIGNVVSLGKYIPGSIVKHIPGFNGIDRDTVGESCMSRPGKVTQKKFS